MAYLHVLCGLPGSGKSTFAKQHLTRVKAVRLANDDWMVPLFGTNPPEAEFRSAVRKIEALQWKLACELLTLGIDVIWDYGVWSRADRAELHQKCTAVGAGFLLYDVQCDFETAVSRVLSRAADKPDSELQINRDAMLLFKAKYEPPSLSEGYEIITVQGAGANAEPLG